MAGCVTPSPRTTGSFNLAWTARLATCTSTSRWTMSLPHATFWLYMVRTPRNDHVPWYPCKVVTLGFLEDVEVGTCVSTFIAKDGDGSLANSGLRYSLTFDPELGRAGGSSLLSSTSFAFRIHPLPTCFLIHPAPSPRPLPWTARGL